MTNRIRWYVWKRWTSRLYGQDRRRRRRKRDWIVGSGHSTTTVATTAAVLVGCGLGYCIEEQQYNNNDMNVRGSMFSSFTRVATLTSDEEEEECPYRTNLKEKRKSSSSPSSSSTAKATSGCPMNGSSSSSSSSSSPSSGGGCPMKGSATSSGENTVKVFNVYAQEINPLNQMPYNVNQLPTSDQKKPLSTERVRSSIPKGGTDSTWTYPSPQIFYNALKRKGKADDVTENDMGAVVAVHNSMNEQTWQKLLLWERTFHGESVENLKLVRFMGRPHDLSPKARFLSTVGLRPKPFDRHDWIVTRGDDTPEVRYVIDYYYDESGQIGNTNLPVVGDGGRSSRDDKGGRVIYVDVRPALDSVGSAFDRVRMFFNREQNEDQDDSNRTIDASAAAYVVKDPEAAAKEMRRKQDALRKKDEIARSCRSFVRDLQECDSEDACNMALMGLKLCMAKHACDASVVRNFLDADDDASGEKAFAKVEACLKTYERESNRLLRP